MYSLVMMAAMTATPDVPQDFLCPVSPSKYGGGYFSKHCFYDCCLPARYGWVNCWNKGFGYYPGGSRSFCGSCATASYGNFYNPSCCNAGCGAGSSSCGYGFAGCSTGCGTGHGFKDWGIGCTPAYWTGVTGCKPCVTAPPYAHYTQRNPCCTYGHFAFDTGLIGHSYGVGYAGFGAHGNYGFFGSVPTQHPPTVADIPRYQPQDFMPQEARPYVPARDYTAPGYVPAEPSNNLPPAAAPEAPRVPSNPGSYVPPAPEKVDPSLGTPPANLNPPLPAGLPEIPKAPNVPIVPTPAPAGADKKDLPLPKPGNKTAGVSPIPSTVILSVPAGATVFVEGVQLRSQAAERSFRTPALQPGREYGYTVKAIVVENGLEHTEVRQVTVIPGETTTVSFEKLLARFGAPSNAVTQTGGK